LKKRTEQNNIFKFPEKRNGERKKDNRKTETEEKQKNNTWPTDEERFTLKSWVCQTKKIALKDQELKRGKYIKFHTFTACRVHGKKNIS